MGLIGRIAALYLAVLALQAQTVPDIGSRRELFVDRFLIERLQGAELRAQQPIEKGIVLELDQPWEGAFSGYFTVIQEPQRFRLYYRCVPNAKGDGNASESTCYAESADGVHWKKPDLGLFEVYGTRKNNVILANQPPFSHNFAPFLDARPGVPTSERYKALAGTAKSGLVAFASADGIHWRKLREQPVLPASSKSMYDSQNVAFWSTAEGKYVCYFRIFKQFPSGGIRWVARTTSKDFLDWTTACRDDLRRCALRTPVHEPDQSLFPGAASLHRHRCPLHAGATGTDCGRGGGDTRRSEVLPGLLGRGSVEHARRVAAMTVHFSKAFYGPASGLRTGFHEAITRLGTLSRQGLRRCLSW